MRKDGKSQYTIKKEKLLKIKKILKGFLECLAYDLENDEIDILHLIQQIWEIVKDEK